MEEKKLAEAKMHYEKLQSIADSMDLSIEELMEKCSGGGEEESEEKEPMGGPGKDKAKIALIVAKMRKPSFEE